MWRWRTAFSVLQRRRAASSLCRCFFQRGFDQRLTLTYLPLSSTPTLRHQTCNRLIHEAIRERKCKDNCTVLLLRFDHGSSA